MHNEMQAPSAVMTPKKAGRFNGKISLWLHYGQLTYAWEMEVLLDLALKLNLTEHNIVHTDANS